MKKIISGLVCLCMLFIFTGCGSEETVDLTSNIKTDINIEVGNVDDITVDLVMKDLDKLDIDANDITIEFDKDKINEVGTVEGKVIYGDKEYPIEIKVTAKNDPNAPILIDGEYYTHVGNSGKVFKTYEEAMEWGLAEWDRICALYRDGKITEKQKEQYEAFNIIHPYDETGTFELEDRYSVQWKGTPLTEDIE